MRNKGLIATAIGAALAAPVLPALAQTATDSQANTAGSASQDSAQQFQRADRNRDGYLDEQEARAASLPQLDEQGFQQADADGDGRLSQREFQTAMDSTGQAPGQTTAQEGAANQRDITVQQQPAQVQVEQQPPEVVVRQNEPEVIIKQPEPNVQITQPEPNVQIERAQPDVSVQQQGQPQVQVQQGEQADVQVVRPRDAERAAGGSEGTRWDMTAGDLEGKKVVNARGEDLGEVDHVALGNDDQPHVIMSVGGFWNIGSRDVAVPLSDLQLQDDELRMTTDRTEDELKQLAESQQARDYRPLDREENLAQYGAGGTSPDTQQATFQQLDANQDGYISADEAADHQALSRQWNDADTNQDGRLDQSEFSAFEADQQ